MDFQGGNGTPDNVPHSYFEGTPLQLLHSEKQGRYLVAARDIQENEVVLTAVPYLTAILPSHRKRVCATCFNDMRKRLTLCCSFCSYSHYCSPECQRLHATPTCTPSLFIPPSRQPSQQQGPQAPIDWQVPWVPHTILCGVVKRFSSFKFDGDMAATLLMVLETLAIHHLQQQQQQPTYLDEQLHNKEQQEQQLAPRPNSREAKQAAKWQYHKRTLSHADFMLLTSGVKFTHNDRQDWIKGARFLVAAMQKSGWLWELPSEVEIVDLCSKVISNNFGVWAPKQQYPVEHAVYSPEAHNQLETLAHSIAHFDLTCSQNGEGGAGGEVGFEPGHAELLVYIRDAGGSSSSKHEGTRGVASAEAYGSSHGVPSSVESSSMQQSKTALIEQSTTTAPVETQPSRPAFPESAAAANLARPSRPAVPKGAAASVEAQPSKPGTPESAAAANAAQPLQRTAPVPITPLITSPSITPSTDPSSPGAAATTSEPLPSPARTATQANAEGQPSTDAPPTLRHIRDELTGRQVYINASYFNHSCSPNLLVDHCGHLAVVRATEAIPAGTEANISYIDLEMPVGARRAELQQCFNFLCQCSRCLQELETGSGKVTWSRSAQVSGKHKEKGGKGKGKKRKIRP